MKNKLMWLCFFTAIISWVAFSYSLEHSRDMFTWMYLGCSLSNMYTGNLALNTKK